MGSFTAGAGTSYLLSSTAPVPSGTANGVLFLNGSKVVTSGSALTFDGTNFGVGTASPTLLFQVGSRGGMDSTGIFRWGSALTGNNRGVLSWDTNIASIGAPQNLVFCANSETTERMRLDSSGNLGLGVTPSAWGGSLKALQVGVASAFYNTGANTAVANNFYNDGSNSRYLTSNFATAYVQNSSGQHAWFAAPSGTAGNAISFTQAMTLDSAGNLGLGVTPSAWASGWRAFQTVGGNSFYSDSNVSALASNAIFDGAWKYFNTTGAGTYQIDRNAHKWFIAASGTSGNVISFTQAMTLDASGNLGIGTTSPGSKLEVAAGTGFPTARFTRVGTAAQTGALVIGMSQIGFSGSTNADALLRSDYGFGLQVNSAGSLVTALVADLNGNVVIGTAALATNATNGFFYVAGCAGVPTGTPTAYTGRVPIVVDTTNNKLYFYSGGAWRDAGP